jgi:hypothetical protein
MTMPDTTDALARIDDHDAIVHISTTAVGAIVKSEVEAQLDAAHKYPRSVTRFLRDATMLATLTTETAEACIYTLPRDGKMITGPSVRLAEICASAWGNIRFGARVVDEEDKVVVAQGSAWDLERNTGITLEARRSIVGKRGRFSNDMIVVTGNAAASIALRNAILRVIPRGYVNQVYEHVRKVAVGDEKTIEVRRTAILDRLGKLGVPVERILQRVDKKGKADLGFDELEILLGLMTAIKNGEATVDEAFPAPAPAPLPPSEDGKRVSLRGAKAEPPKSDTPKADAPREPGSEG